MPNSKIKQVQVGSTVYDVEPANSAALTVTNGTSTLTWGQDITVGTVNGTNITAKLPANPNSHSKHKINSGKKSNGTTDIMSTDASSDNIILGDSGVMSSGTTKSVGNDDNVSPDFGDTFNVPYITVNSKGIVVGAVNNTVQIPSGDGFQPANAALSDISELDSTGFLFFDSSTGGVNTETFSFNDGIFDNSIGADYKTLSVAPYPSTTATSTWVANADNAGKFYLGTENPKKTTRLNYNGYFYAAKLYGNDSQGTPTEVALSGHTHDYLPLAPTANTPVSAPIYLSHADLSFIGTKGAFGFRATDSTISGWNSHLGQINLSKNLGDATNNQYGIQMSAADVLNNKFNQFKVNHNGIVYNQYLNASGNTTDIFSVNTSGDATITGKLITNGTISYDSTHHLTLPNRNDETLTTFEDLLDSNVKLSDTLTCHYPLGNLTASATNPKTWASGTALRTVLTDIMTMADDTSELLKTNPSISMTVRAGNSSGPRDGGTAEYGTEYSGIYFKISTDDGEYKYGPDPTGVTFSNYSATIDGASGSAAQGTVVKVYKVGITGTINWSASATSSNGSYAKSRLGNTTDQRFTSTTRTADGTFSITPVYSTYYCLRTAQGSQITLIKDDGIISDDGISITYTAGQLLYVCTKTQHDSWKFQVNNAGTWSDMDVGTTIIGSGNITNSAGASVSYYNYRTSTAFVGGGTIKVRFHA